MRELAPGVWQLSGLLPNVVNTYLIGDVLVDAGARQDTGRILKQLAGRTLSAHALTHAHADHQGASRAVCERFGVPFWVGAADVAAAEDPRVMLQEMPDHFMARASYKVFHGPGHPVDRRLHEGDEVAGFTVLEVPGHSRGHVAFWREADRVLLCGDVLTNMDTVTLLPGLHEPKTFWTPDPARNRESAKRLGALRPQLVCFGHGAPLRDAQKFEAFCASL